jgi:hypothetical protein
VSHPLKIGLKEVYKVNLRDFRISATLEKEKRVDIRTSTQNLHPMTLREERLTKFALCKGGFVALACRGISKRRMKRKKQVKETTPEDRLEHKRVENKKRR